MLLSTSLRLLILGPAKQLLQGDRGLLFTDSPPEEVLDWFADYKQADYARTGNVVDEEFILPEGESLQLDLDLDNLETSLTSTAAIEFSGPIMMNEAPAPHSLEPQFRKLGLATYLVKGVPTLKAPHTVCKKGDTLNPNQVNLLQLFGKTMSEVSISWLFPRRRFLEEKKNLIITLPPCHSSQSYRGSVST